ncbi:MAG: hypothetical protein ACI8PV_000453 [Dinoroseobacter sp.]
MEKTFQKLTQALIEQDKRFLIIVDRRLCSKKHFDTYFRLTPGEGILSTKLILELQNRAGEREFVIDTMKGATNKIRCNGQALVPVYLTHLTTHAENIKTEDMVGLISALLRRFLPLGTKTTQVKISFACRLVGSFRFRIAL